MEEVFLRVAKEGEVNVAARDDSAFGADGQTLAASEGVGQAVAGAALTCLLLNDSS